MVAAAVVGGAVIGAGGSMMASSSQAGASKAATEAQSAQAAQTRLDNMPWHDAGVSALGDLQTGMKGDLGRSFTLADYNADPGYQFRLDQGTQSLERSAAARGGLLSGGFAKDLTDYSQGMASQEYSNAYNRFNQDHTTQFNRLASIAGIGQTANAENAQAGQAAANGISDAAIAGGNARASAYTGVASSINSGINNMMYYNKTAGAALPSYAPAPALQFDTAPAYTPTVGGY